MKHTDNSYETRSSNIPVDGVRGKWEGERGESKYVPSDETDEGKAAKEKLAEKDQDGVEYNYAEPDFSESAEATVEIDNMTEHRDDYIDADGKYQSGKPFSTRSLMVFIFRSNSQLANTRELMPVVGTNAMLRIISCSSPAS